MIAQRVFLGSQFLCQGGLKGGDFLFGGAMAWTVWLCGYDITAPLKSFIRVMNHLVHHYSEALKLKKWR